VTPLADDHLRNASAAFAHLPAIQFGQREISWRQFDEAVDVLARRLLTLGLSPADCVMIVSENSPEFLILCFAVWRAGGAMAVVHAGFDPRQLDYALTNAAPRFLFAEAARKPGVTEALQRTGLSVAVLDIEAGGETLAHIRPRPDGLARPDPEAVGVIGYTSGTTGAPKPVALSHGAIGNGTAVCARTWRITSADAILVSMPLSWLAGLIILSITAAVAGARIQLLRQPSPEETLRAMILDGTTFFFASTSLYVKLLKAWREGAQDGSFRLRCCISGGETRNETTFRAWRAITGVPVLDSYGASECWPFVTHDPGSVDLPPAGSAGKLVDGAKLRLVDPNGREVAHGEPGEAQGRAPSMMLGYWREPELTARAMTSDGWYRFGDYARVDDDGFVYVLGRTGDLIRTEGGPVFPSEVEQVLSELEDVVQVAAVGLPGLDGQQIVGAAVQLAPGASSDEASLRAHCEQRLTDAHAPRVIRIVGELPHNPSGKVLRREVQALLQWTGEPIGR
jgi:long-chain acyl-CoA synthetase